MVLLFCQPAWGQKTGIPLGSIPNLHLEIANLDQFPDVILSGNSYVLGAWVRNTGTTPLSGELTVFFSVDGDPATRLGEPMSVLQPVVPGDSIWWQSTDTVQFNGNRFGGGGIANDIIVWPTSTGVSIPDTIRKPVVFVHNSGFETTNNLITGLPPTIDPNTYYSANINAINQDIASTTFPVQFYVQVGNLKPRLIKSVAGIVEVGDTVGFLSPFFNLANLYGQQGFWLMGTPTPAYIWAVEKKKNRWVQFATFTVTSNVLPVTLTSFSGWQDHDQIAFEWTTSSEQNSEQFILQRTTSDPAGFIPIAEVAAAGNSDKALSYKAIDPDPAPGRNVYRLIQTDLDGAHKVVGQTLEIWFDDPGVPKLLSVSPNPFRQQLSFEIRSPGFLQVNLSLNDLSGKTIASFETNFEAGVHIWETPMPKIPAGVYLYKLTIGGERFSGKLIRAR
jgi:hypothetical protein